MSVGAIDLGILLVYLVGVVALGLWIGRGAKDVSEYVVGGRDLPWWLILFSIIATETSSVTFLSIPGFAYDRDLTWLQIALGFPPRALRGLRAPVAPVFPRLALHRLRGPPPPLRRRHPSRPPRLLFIVTRSLADGLRLFLTALVFQEMTGIALHWAVAALGVTTIAYTYVGGHAGGAVEPTSSSSSSTRRGGGGVLGDPARACPEAGDELLVMGEAGGKLRMLDLSLDWSEPYGLWAGLLGGVFITLGSHGVDQMMVQRYLSARGLPEAGAPWW